MFIAGTAASVAVTVTAGADFEPVTDEALRLLWQSRLRPLHAIRIDIVDAEDLNRDAVRHVNAIDQKDELDGKYGPRPT